MLKILTLALLLASANVNADTRLLNVSYDVTREFYREYNAAFVKFWKQKIGETITINQSHGGSSKQVRPVSDGLEADVVTMNQSSDIDMLYEHGKLIPKDWQKRLPNAISHHINYWCLF